jgi:hypothetical protein
MTFFHNITRGIVNMSDMETLALNSDPEDRIMYTRSGNAILYSLDGEYAKNLKEERERLKELEAKEEDYHQND